MSHSDLLGTLSVPVIDNLFFVRLVHINRFFSNRVATFDNHLKIS